MKRVLALLLTVLLVVFLASCINQPKKVVSLTLDMAGISLDNVSAGMNWDKIHIDITGNSYNKSYDFSKGEKIAVENLPAEGNYTITAKVLEAFAVENAETEYDTIFEAKENVNLNEGPNSITLKKNQAVNGIDSAVISPVTNLKATVSGSSVYLTWSSSYTSTSYSYKVYRKLATASTYTLLSTVYTKSYTNTNVPNGSYVYAIRVYRSGSYSSYTTTSVTVGSVGPAEPIDFTAPYSGNYLLVSNESLDPNTTQSTGKLPNMEALNREMTVAENLPLGAYRIDPKLPIKKDAKKPVMIESRVTYNVGDTKTFNVFNFSTNANTQLSATVQYVGTQCVVYAADTNEITTAKAQQIGQEFDSNIYNLVATNFYTPSDINGDGKVAILCYDIQDGFGTNGNQGYVGGYFYGGDLYNQADSNNMEMFYIDTYPSMRYPQTNPVDVTQAFSTLVHEFQHMVNFNRNVAVENNWNSDVDMDTFINEGLSMAAEHIYGGVVTDRINYYNSSTSIRDGHSLLFWDYDGDTLSNYSLSYLFIQYLRTQAGQGTSIYKELLNDTNNNYKCVENIVKKYVSSTMTFQQFMTNYRLALLLKQATGYYGFKGESGFNSISTPYYTSTTAKSIRGGGAIVKAKTSDFTPSGAGTNIKFVGIQK